MKLHSLTSPNNHFIVQVDRAISELLSSAQQKKGKFDEWKEVQQ
jgi:hypothetical protein